MYKRIQTFRGLLCFVLSFTLSVCFTEAHAQTREVPHAMILEKAPHLPLMAEAKTSDAFYGEHYAYARVENEKKIMEWVSKYPNEFKSYIVEIQKYLEVTKEASLRDSDRRKQADLKAQWVMIQQMNLTLPAETVNTTSQN